MTITTKKTSLTMNNNDQPIKRTPGFKKGQSGNPNGRPKGYISQVSMFFKQQCMDRGSDVIQTVIKKALDGDIAAAKIVIDKILPNCKDHQVKMELPSMKDLSGINDAMDVVINTVSGGTITPLEGQSIMSLVDSKHKLLVSTDLEKRIQDLESIAKENYE